MFNYRRELMSIAKSGGIPTDGLVLYYPFDTPVAVGGTVQDMSTSDNDGTLSGDAFVDSNGLNLGGDGNINCGHDTSLDIGTSFTWQAAFSCAKSNVWEYVIAKPHDNAGLGIHTNLIFSYFKLEDGSYVIVSCGPSIVVGRKYNLAITYENRTFKIYVDGQLKTTKTITQDFYSSNTYDLFIGGKISRRFEGHIYKVLAYNRALSLDEIQKLQ